MVLLLFVHSSDRLFALLDVWKLRVRMRIVAIEDAERALRNWIAVLNLRWCVGRGSARFVRAVLLSRNHLLLLLWNHRGTCLVLLLSHLVLHLSRLQLLNLLINLQLTVVVLQFLNSFQIHFGSQRTLTACIISYGAAWSALQLLCHLHCLAHLLLFFGLGVFQRVLFSLILQHSFLRLLEQVSDFSLLDRNTFVGWVCFVKVTYGILSLNMEFVKQVRVSSTHGWAALAVAAAHDFT